MKHHNRSIAIVDRRDSDRGCICSLADQGAGNYRRVGFAQRHHHDQRQATPRARSELRRRDQGRCPEIDAVVGAAHRAAQGARPTSCSSSPTMPASACRALSAG